MLAKHFKELLKNINDDEVILFDNDDGTYSPLRSCFQLTVTTQDEPGDRKPEFVTLEDFIADVGDADDMREYKETFGEPPIFKATIFSVDNEIEDNVVEQDDKITE